MISNFLFNFTDFCVIVGFFNQTSKLDVLFSTAVNEKFVAKPLIVGIFLFHLILAP